MRQRVSVREHFRRGNTPRIQIVALQTDSDLAGSGAGHPRNPDAPTDRDGIDHPDDPRRRQPGAIRTLDLNLRYPTAGTLAGWCGRDRSGGFFTMAHGYHNRYQKTTRQAVRRPLDRPLFPVTVIRIV
jgi:hypothetical protein